MACRSEFVPVITANLLAIAIVASVSVSPVLTDNGTLGSQFSSISVIFPSSSMSIPIRQNSPDNIGTTRNFVSSMQTTKEAQNFYTVDLESITYSNTNTSKPPTYAIVNFTAKWETSETALDEPDYIILNWMDNSNRTKNSSNIWNLNVSSERLNISQSRMIIHSNCSLEKNSSFKHKVKLLPSKNTIVCSGDDRSETFNLNITACVSYHLTLFYSIKNFSNNLTESSQTELKPAITSLSRPSIPTAHYSNRTLTIRWNKSTYHEKCATKYCYRFTVDQNEWPPGVIDDENITHHILPSSCSNYSLFVWILDNDCSEMTTQSESAALSNTKSIETVLSETGVKLSVSPVNQTCLLANWSLIEEDLDDILDCVNSFRIKLNSPVQSDSTYYQISKNMTEKVVCHLQPGTMYTVSLQILGRDESLYFLFSQIQYTHNVYDTRSPILIIVASLLVVIVVGLGLYITRQWIARRFIGPQRLRQSLRLQTSLFGNLIRQRSHPVKIGNLEEVTKYLCSSASYLLEMEFEDLVILADAQRHEPSSLALHPENGPKNRYINILPYEHTRVPLSLIPEKPHSDYINASYIPGFNNEREYIASQGPKKCTIEDFWRMIWQQNVHIIVMVTSLEERGKQKCDLYWPEDMENPLVFDDLTIDKLNAVDFENYVLRRFKVELNGNHRVVQQAYLKEWPDFGVPENPETLVHFTEVVRILICETPPPKLPILVHCSAGVGRTGTYIAVDWLMQEARVKKEIDIFTTVLRMRECRANMVQSQEQYEYVYRCLSHFVNTRLFSNTTTLESNQLEAANLLINDNDDNDDNDDKLKI